MIIKLEDISRKELDLLQRVNKIDGTIEERTQKIYETNIYELYSNLHLDYFKIFNSTSDELIKLEALKRLIFINWYYQTEPSIYTGIGFLNQNAIYNSFDVLNKYIIKKKLDIEFKWMLSYYSCWDFTILQFSEGKLDALTNFVKSVDEFESHIPKHTLIMETMKNRGQMGEYFQSLNRNI